MSSHAQTHSNLRSTVTAVINTLSGFLLAFGGNREHFTLSGSLLNISRTVADDSRKILQDVEEDLSTGDLSDIGEKADSLERQLAKVDKLLKHHDFNLDPRVTAWSILSKQIEPIIDRLIELHNVMRNALIPAATESPSLKAQRAYNRGSRVHRSSFSGGEVISRHQPHAHARSLSNASLIHTGEYSHGPPVANFPGRIIRSRTEIGDNWSTLGAEGSIRSVY
ncbi:hypothetical protein DL96DRAFT_1819058 [Flagelloscypha sp. PMI_526]|nr:hypothetical protein DL96DRAFT_1819058 [Flagelloscypha sp. PMI_526]